MLPLRPAHEFEHLHEPASESRRRQDHILDVAEKLFARHGFDATSMRDVAQAAGVNVATLYYHCGSKEQLFAFIYARVVDRMAAFVGQTLASDGDFAAVVGGIVDRVVEFFLRHPSVPRLLERAHLGEVPGAKSRRKAYRPLMDAVSAELQRRAALGQIRDIGDPVSFVHAAAGVFFHLIIDATDLDQPNAHRARAEARSLASLQAQARMFVLGALGIDPMASGTRPVRTKKGDRRGNSL